MTEYRKSLLRRIIELYGENHTFVQRFTDLCERYSNTPWNDEVLSLIVNSHEDMEAPFLTGDCNNDV